MPLQDEAQLSSSSKTVGPPFIVVMSRSRSSQKLFIFSYGAMPCVHKEWGF